MKKLIILLCFVIILTGCADMVELEDRGFVISMAIDKVDENFNVSLAVARVENFATDTNMSFGTDEDTSAKTILTSQAKTIEQAIKNMDSLYGKKLYFGHLKMCVFGQELLKDKQYFKNLLLFTENNSDISKNILILCAKNPEEIIKAKAKSNVMVALAVEDFYKNNCTDQSIKLDFITLLNNLKKSKTIYIPAIIKDNESLKISGLYEIEDYTFKREVSTQETKNIIKKNE